MWIIVEGPDRVGKTTFIARYFSVIRKVTPPKFVNDAQIYAWQKASARMSNRQNLVFDRFHLSQYVYATTLRGMDKCVAAQNMARIDEMLPLCVIYLITAAAETVAARDDGNSPPIELLNDITHAFLEAAWRARHRVVLLQNSGDTYAYSGELHALGATEQQ